MAMVKVPAPDLASTIEPFRQTGAAEGIILVRGDCHRIRLKSANQIDGRRVRARIIKRDVVAGAERGCGRAIEPVGSGRVPVVGGAIAVPGQVLRERGGGNKKHRRCWSRSRRRWLTGEIKTAEAGEIGYGGEFGGMAVWQ